MTLPSRKPPAKRAFTGLAGSPLAVIEEPDKAEDVVDEDADLLLVENENALEKEFKARFGEFDEIDGDAEYEPGEFPDGKTKLKGPPPEKDWGPTEGRLERLYAEYVDFPTQENERRFLKEVEVYARYITRGEGGAYSAILTDTETEQYPQTDTSMLAMMKVWLTTTAPPSVRSKKPYDPTKSSIETWVHRIAMSVHNSRVRHIVKHPETDQLLEWKDYNADKSTRRSGGNTGAGPDSAIDDAHNDEADGGGHGAAPVPGQRDFRNGGQDPFDVLIPGRPGREKALDEWRARLDLLVLFLPSRDQRIVQMLREGKKPLEIGKAFKMNAKWASNQIDRIKKELREQANRKS